MPSLYQIKPRFQALLRPLCQRLAAAGVTANQLTIAAVLLSAVGGLLLVLNPHSRWPWLLLPPLLLVRMALNALDGMLAREHGQQSALGAILNELGDVVADAALYAPLALLSGVSAGAVALLLWLAALTEMTGLATLQAGASRRYDGPLGKSDRALVIGSLGVLLGLGVTAGSWLNSVVWLLNLLLLITVVNRARLGLHELTLKHSKEH